ncbi:NhaP-type Na+(K+)/H+ antiporter [Xenococcus sp. PCC 7305]|uniref:cation:proton antiporter n=1 Tax=Xenococcus sp. PCC 7305 TaxID=102125 RepID=UPI0002ABB097|nr:cation:proton antiporter [Xenococcus sp. PCC 7305]ELS03973.1 NhaP-type Na+(K+)/H+ antiporter [Xenococcus sp. PCC 7305]
MQIGFLLSIILILLLGFFGGQLARRMGAPPLMGMIIVGILLGSEVSNATAPSVLELADDLRTMAVMVILMRAGLGLDRDKLLKQGNVALRLGVLPAIAEALMIALAAIWLFQFDFLTGLLLGCVVSAESPAVIVPGMLRLKSLGWGTRKGIADAILTGSALSDVFVLLLFSLLLNFLSQSAIDSNALWLLPWQVISQIILGVIIGYLGAKLIFWLTIQQQWTQNTVQDTLITASLALLIIVLAEQLPYFSGYLAAMALGFFLIEFSPPLARRLRGEFNHLWIVAEILLFVLMGATIQLKVLENIFLPGILLLAFGLICGRTIGWYGATVGSNWNWREKLFLLPGNSAKATVQAAIGGIPLSQGIPGGEIILAVAALSILITAPLGAWAIPTFAPKLLTQDPVDPTKTEIATPTIFLAAIDTSDLAVCVLTKVADLARRSNGEAIVIHLTNTSSESDILRLQQLTSQLLLDIPHQFLTMTGSIPEEIIRLANEYQVTDIIMGKRGHQPWEKVLIGSVSQAVIETSTIPVILVEEIRC